jgi:hypothetical protein
MHSFAQCTSVSCCFLSWLSLISSIVMRVGKTSTVALVWPMYGQNNSTLQLIHAMGYSGTRCLKSIQTASDHAGAASASCAGRYGFCVRTGALRSQRGMLHEQQVRARPCWVHRQGLQPLIQRHRSSLPFVQRHDIVIPGAHSQIRASPRLCRTTMHLFLTISFTAHVAP